MDTLSPRHVSTLTYFVSYAWSMPFRMLVELLQHHLASADPEQASPIACRAGTLPSGMPFPLAALHAAQGQAAQPRHVPTRGTVVPTC